MSEFGRGYATCLIQFTFHRARLAEQVEGDARMRGKYPDWGGSEHTAEMWASGSSDHLAELIRPRKGITGSDWQGAKALTDRALDIGHGFQPSSKSDPAECYRLLDEAARLLALTGATTLDEAMAWDKAHGLTPEKGDWSCSEDLSRADRVAAR